VRLSIVSVLLGMRERAVSDLESMPYRRRMQPDVPPTRRVTALAHCRVVDTRWTVRVAGSLTCGHGDRRSDFPGACRLLAVTRLCLGSNAPGSAGRVVDCPWDQSRDSTIAEHLARRRGDGMREEQILSAAEEELGARLWYARSRSTMDGDDQRSTPDIQQKRAETRLQIEAKYGVESLWPLDEYQWGYLEGRLSAVRWALGQDWGKIET